MKMSATSPTMHYNASDITIPVFTADPNPHRLTSTQPPASFFHLPYDLRHEIYLNFLPDDSSSWAKRPKASSPPIPGPRLACRPPESHYLSIKRRGAGKAREFTRLQIQRERDRIERGDDYIKYKGPKIRKLTPERVPPGLELLCVSKQVYREFAPLFYRYTCRNAVFKGHRVGILNENQDEDWGLDHLETMLSPQSTALNLGRRDGVSPIYLCEAMHIYVPNLTTHALARRWLSALSRLEEITTEAQKSGLSRLRYLCVRFWMSCRFEDWNGTEPPEWAGDMKNTTLNVGDCETTASTTTRTAITHPTLRPLQMVPLSENIPLAKTICRFRGLEKLTLHGFRKHVWPQILHENMQDPDLALWRANFYRVRGSGGYGTWHSTMYGMKAAWERKDKFAGQPDENVRNQLYEEHVAVHRDYGRWTRPLFQRETVVDVAKRIW